MSIAQVGSQRAGNDEGRNPPQTPALHPQQIPGDSEAEIARNQRDRRDKLIATAVARAALGGFTLHLVSDGDGGSCFLISRWCLSRTLADLDAVDAFLDRAGGPDAPMR